MNLSISGLYKSFPGVDLYQDFRIEFREGRITGILGPSGCGKTTLLNMITGTIAPDSGEFLGLAGKRVSCIFQEPRLLPWKTVSENVEFVLKDLFPQNDRSKIVSGLLKMVSLGDFAGHYPREISSGMRQRAAAARAFAYPSDILVMDEPFRALDLKLKRSLINSFRKLWDTDRRTVVFVTHDVDEALMLCDEIYIFGGPPVRIIKKIAVTLSDGEYFPEDSLREAIKNEIYHCMKG
ncbi:ABC transporter ATP-binding protein [Phosphitispora fastidiosa]|uniref:ABC transporter ATP-binding protein n=1 Tax=Phosphitispora fastidiosa TaxID=2837202 RepID=UPI001E3A2058|nr:ABC transporter ATP-binding protein [Phosphitispora fastidiosa]MBU7006744.1 NitT/TauT family transport system ATP-binding protein [Phosphitispora fastidiosa]